jgi:hypothetical protein
MVAQNHKSSFSPAGHPDDYKDIRFTVKPKLGKHTTDHLNLFQVLGQASGSYLSSEYISSPFRETLYFVEYAIFIRFNQ